MQLCVRVRVRFQHLVMYVIQFLWLCLFSTKGNSVAKNFIFSVILVTVVLVVPLNLAWIRYRQTINLELKVSDPSMLNNQDYQFTALNFF